MTDNTPRSAHTREFLTGGFFLLALVVAMTVFFAARQRMADDKALTTLTTASQLANVLSSARMAESGQRGFLLTGNATYLGPYHIALKGLPAELQALDKSLGKTPQGGNLTVIHEIIDSKLSELAKTITLYQSGDQEGAIGLVKKDSGMTEMTRLRELIGKMSADLAQQQAKNEAEDARYGWILQTATALAALGTLALAVFAIRESRLRNNQLRAAESALREINEYLERKVEERTRNLYASEMQFQTLAESMPGFVFISDTSSRNIYVNPQFTAYTGLTQAQMLGNGWQNFMHPQDVHAARITMANGRASGHLYELEYRLRRRDGVFRWFLVRSTPITSDAGDITGWVGICTDIHDHKQAEAKIVGMNVFLEEQVAERSRELDRMFRLSTDILAVASFSGRYVSVSPAWEKILGRPIAEALASNFADFVHPDHFVSVAQDFEQLRRGNPVYFENRYRRADGSYCWLSWRAVPEPEEELIYAVARDVTAAKDRDEQLRQSQKMEVVGQLTGGIAHDFNNLLTIIMGSLELLQRGLKDPDTKTTRRIEAAMDGGRRAAALTHRLLAFARRQPLEPKAIEPDRLVAGMSDMLSRVLGEHIALEFVNAAGLWRVQADVNQLENCILNLAVNARDAMRDGGHLTIETQNVYLDESYAASRPDVQPGQYVMIAVTDTGTGMAEDIRGKVFEPFFTTKPQGQGTGLGLAQVYGFIKQSNGHVAIYSEVGHGTSVKLYLPRLRDAVKDEPKPSPQAPKESQSHGETILVVEDEENVLKFVAEVLEDAGYSIVSAENATSALDVLKTTPVVDLLFTDVVLSGMMNGRLLADEVLRQRPGIAVLFTTGYTRNAIVHHGRLDDGIDFIGKPFTASALVQTVRKILDRGKASKSSSALLNH